MHPFVEKILLLHRLGRRISEAGSPDQTPPPVRSLDDIPSRELLGMADGIATAIARRENFDVDDEKAVLAAAFLLLRRRTERDDRPTFRSYLFA